MRLLEAKAARRTGKRRVESLPGPPALPVIGTSHLLDLGRLHLQLEGWARRYGTPYSPTEVERLTRLTSLPKSSPETSTSPSGADH